MKERKTDGYCHSCRHIQLLRKHTFNVSRKWKTPKNCFLAACKLWDENIKLVAINHKFPNGGLIGYGNSFLDFFFARLKVFRLYAILHDSAGAVKATTNRVQDTVTCYQTFLAHVSWDI